jgi:hypothetical protein
MDGRKYGYMTVLYIVLLLVQVEGIMDKNPHCQTSIVFSLLYSRFEFHDRILFKRGADEGDCDEEQWKTIIEIPNT